MSTFDFPSDLLAAERAAWEAIQTGTLTVAQATAVHDGITAYASEVGADRHQVEMALKRAVRHPAEG
ncbi:hypothetical protein JL475_00705 [Streptomyces sp. M2CJ-2]|uniref:hypothetical protein n=1 Tax=Streptomyces sp. M2CJ-2 TaxID=2803948 RepID=UPI001924D628|nr:hypothetical protein [Streptomyces sp. M2CJ-2]MBL3664567.1 hypothetical protein [Streptomyces sp. M2CJ-2]